MNRMCQCGRCNLGGAVVVFQRLTKDLQIGWRDAYLLTSRTAGSPETAAGHYPGDTACRSGCSAWVFPVCWLLEWIASRIVLMSVVRIISNRDAVQDGRVAACP